MRQALTVTAVEELVMEVRARHRQRLERLTEVAADQQRLQRELFPPPPPEPGLWQRLWHSLGQPDPHDEVDQLESLEHQIETGQQLVVRLAHHLDTLRLSRTAQQVELAEHQGLADTSQAAADECRKQGPHGEAEAVTHDRVAARLRRVVQLHHEALEADRRITAGVAALYDAATEALDVIDAQLSHAAAEARARDLATLLHGAGPLHDAVQRVRRLAGEGSLVVDQSIDRLASEVDLLAPADPEALAAEAEVAAFLKR